ncbi:arylsulfatase B-like [Paramacrobiotus metropolitanus]|uniref:arylsulfatase B-like n=1 Tax=Paramacrobiotus metropolitanus TaxID=2943436 RepID=UPI0024465277|nr:arylsulfatase B-like [Paramacrobiotus metropolitanus]
MEYGNVACTLFLIMPALTVTAVKQPNIVFILADDLGWTDVSFHGYDEIPTPNIDILAEEGVILHDYYAQYLCTPSRVALMTGKYPFRTGMQRLVLQIGEDRALPLEEKLLPEYLKDLGYSTHIIGKWHLGYSKRTMTPLYRGFDSFFGYYAGANDYFNYTPEVRKEEWRGFDLWDNVTACQKCKGQYSTNLFTEVAIKKIDEHHYEKPLFLYFSHMAPHAAGKYDPTQAPWKDEKHFSYIKHDDRREHAAMVNVMDQSVGKNYAFCFLAIGGRSWDAISEGLPSPREEIVHQIDPVGPEYAIRWKNYKLVYGSPAGLKTKSFRMDHWYKPPNGIHAKFIKHEKAAVHCKKPSHALPCHSLLVPCLFDIEEDPCEYNNLAGSHKNIADLLMEKIREYNTTALPSDPDIFDLDPRAKTAFHHGLIEPWLT